MTKVLVRNTDDCLETMTVTGASAIDNELWLWELTGNRSADLNFPDTITTFNRVIVLDSKEQAEAYVVKVHEEDRVNLSFTTCYDEEEWEALKAESPVQEVTSF